MSDILVYLLQPLLDPMTIFWIAVGVFSGIYIGAIPGLSGTMAISLLVSFTFGWQTDYALALMMGVHVGVVYGGSRSAITLNIPGAPAAVATGFDGYPLAKKGEAGRAMGVVTVQSVLGGYIGFFALAFFTPLVSKLALKFAPRDYLLLAIMGLMLVGSIGSKSIIKGLLTATIGILIGTVGLDPITAIPRYTFGNIYLLSGVDYIVVMLGLFGISEALVQVLEKDMPVVKQSVDKIRPSWKDVTKYIPLTLKSGIIGVLVGALPGAGGDLSALIAYDQAKRTVKNPEVPFGEGAIEGVIAPESANNATIGGTYIPMLTLGIPGDAVTAIMIGALTIHGLKPGPMLMHDTPNLFYFIVSSFMIANFFLLIFGLTGLKIFLKIIEIPKSKLLPMIMVLSIVGTYAINNSVVDIIWMLAFGVIGYFLKMFDYPVAPMVLGVILTNLIETNFRRAIISSKTLLKFTTEFFTDPIAIILIIILIYMFFIQSDTMRNKATKLFKKNKG